jgi:ABC-type transport system involved in multi-copper enzyme maturation permease subunit
MTTWPVRRRQLATILRLELRKSLFAWRSLWLYLLAFAPVLVIGAHAVEGLIDAARGVPEHRQHPLEMDSEVLAGIFQLYYLRLGIFFGCLGLFTRLFRGEMMERSAHHYFLAPVRREVLALGKFLAGAIAASLVFGVAVTVGFGLMYVHFGREGSAFIFGGPGLGHLAGYLGVTVLGCLGYGALFLLLGVLVRNPIIPAVLVLLWESINHVLPSALKLVSVIFYLEPLLPVDAPPRLTTSLFAIPADPVSPFVALPGLLIVTTAILIFACLRVRESEINYSTD